MSEILYNKSSLNTISPATNKILNGITRRTVAKVAQALQLTMVERPFSVAEALAAPEAFLTSASSHVTAIGSIDGTLIGDGHAGPVAKHLRSAYIDFVAGAE